MTRLLQVNQRIITAQEIIPLLAGYQLLPKLLRELIIDEAISSFSYSLQEREQAYQELYQKNQLTTEEQRQAWLDYYQINSEQLEALATRELKIEKFKQATWGEHLKSYFFKYKSKLDRVIYSIIRITDVEIAQELYFRLLDGEQSFAELAKEYSQGQEAQNGGQIGPIALGQLHPALAKILASGQLGQLWSPFRLGEWLVIVQLQQFIPAQLDEQMRQQLLDVIHETWLEEQMQQLKAVSQHN